MNRRVEFCLEHPENGILVEYEYQIPVIDIEPYRAARVSGPPEHCSPAEGGNVDLDSNKVVRRVASDLKAAYEPVSWDKFISAVVFSQQLEPNVIAGRIESAEYQAENYVNEIAYEQICEDADDGPEADYYDTREDD